MHRLLCLQCYNKQSGSCSFGAIILEHYHSVHMLQFFRPPSNRLPLSQYLMAFQTRPASGAGYQSPSALTFVLLYHSTAQCRGQTNKTANQKQMIPHSPMNIPSHFLSHPNNFVCFLHALPSTSWVRHAVWSNAITATHGAGRSTAAMVSGWLITPVFQTYRCF